MTAVAPNWRSELPLSHISGSTPTPTSTVNASGTAERTAASSRKPRRLERFYRIPWWVALLFSIGCLFFTVAAALSYGDVSALRYMQILHINLAGASCFLLGGLLGFIETVLKLASVEVYFRPSKLEDGSGSESDSASAKPEPIDCWITSATLIGTVFFEVPAIVGYYYSAEWTWTQKFFYLNLHTICGVVCFDVYCILTFQKIGGRLFVFEFSNLSFYPPFIYFLGGMPFIVYAVLATLDVYYQVAAVSMAVIGSVLYLVGSIIMMVEIALSDEENS